LIVIFLAVLFFVEMTFTVLTREPPEGLQRIHDRMPLIFPKDLIDEWINHDARPEELLDFAVMEMVLEKNGNRSKSMITQ